MNEIYLSGNFISVNSMRRDHTFALSEKENNLLIVFSALHAFHFPKCNQACIKNKLRPASPRAVPRAFSSTMQKPYGVQGVGDKLNPE